MAKESERIYTSEKQEKIGEVRIADEVVAIIAGLRATEVEGVAAMAGNATREIIERMGMKSLSKGVSVEVIDSTVSVKLSLNLEYGHSIPEVCAKVQERVKSAIENMTGLEVLDVNITIAGVNIDQ